MIDSHIQMPKVVLKQFAIQEGKLKGRAYNYNLETGFIGLGSPKTINTKKGYYSQEAEQEFSKVIEKPLGDVIKDINDSINKKQPFHFNQKVSETIYNYLYALLARAPKMANDVKSAMLFGELYSEQSIHDVSAIEAFLLMQKDKLLKEYKITFFINHTEIPFVLPTCGYYDFKTDEEDGVIHIPLTEKVCVRLFQAKYQDKYIQNGKLLIYPVLNKNVVERVNELAFETQSRYANAYLVSSSKVELERIKGKMTNEK